MVSIQRGGMPALDVQFTMTVYTEAGREIYIGLVYLVLRDYIQLYLYRVLKKRIIIVSMFTSRHPVNALYFHL